MTSNIIQPPLTRRFPLSITPVRIMAILLLITAVVAIGFLMSPPAQRYLADPAGGDPAIGVNEVFMNADTRQNHVFEPAVVQVEAGTTVTWHFSEVDAEGQPVAHNVIFEGFGSEVQETGQFQFTFDEPGVYDYTCTLHSFMDGRVVVVPAATE